VANAQLNLVMRHLRDFRDAQGLTEAPDALLLERFAQGHEEAAFGALLRRHGPMVLGALRRVLRSHQDAEDVFQATFLLLARKAASIRKRESVGSWLHGVAHRLALKAREQGFRRQIHEKRAASMRDTQPPSEAAWHEVQAALDVALQKLPERYRAALVLCYLEGKSHAEAAAQLGCPLATVRTRILRGRKLLRDRLTNHGFALSTAGLASLLLASAAPAAAPVALAKATTKAALAFATGQAAAALCSARVAGLVEGGLHTMFLTKTTTAIAVLLGFVLAAGAAALTRGDDAKDKSQAKAANAQTTAEPAKPDPEKKDDAKGSFTYGGRVLDPDGKPVAGAKLYLLYYTPKSLPVPVRATSNEEGRFRFTVAKTDFDTSDGREPWQAAMVIALADGYGLGVRPMELDKKWDPADQTLYLTKDDQPVSGRILDLQGKPIAGINVTVAGLHWPRKGDLAPLLKEMKERKVFYPPLREQTFGLEGAWMANSLGKLFPTAVTEADGRFTIKGLGRERFVTLRVEGPIISSKEIYAVTRPGGLIEVPGQWSVNDGDAPRLVYGVPFDFAAAPSKPVVGVVRDKDTGKPIPGAIVTSYKIAGSNFVSRTEIRTVADKDGKYRLIGLPKGDGNIIRAGPPEGQPYLMALHSVGDTPGLEPITADFNLKRGAWIEGQVKDKATGKPVHSRVTYAVFDDNPNSKEVPTFSTEDHQQTDGSGTFRVVGLPGRGLIGVRALGGDRYRMGVGADQIKGKGDNGLFRTLPYLLHDRNFHTLVEVNPPKDAQSFTVEVLLDPGLTLKGTVLGPDGKPLAGALGSGLDSYGSSWGHEPLKTAEFTVLGLGPDETRLLQFFHKEKQLSGSVVIKAGQKEAPTVKLGPSGTLTGRLLTPEGKPANDGELIALINDPVPTPGDVKIDLTRGSFHENRIRPDKDGNFRIEGLTPGLTYKLGFIKGYYLHRLGGEAGEMLTIKAGETRKLGDVEVKPFE
jgi:RNA polymerase sigma factor (sigma-70 family)